MIYLLKLKEEITLGLKNNHTAQQILCTLILWQWDDILKGLEYLNKKVSIENFLSVYLCLDLQSLHKYLTKLEEYKNLTGKEATKACLSEKI
ncbi:hypothetical protein CQA49_00070 [Helicobacter sp. MIT 00-7814]|uniref:hypothetical protein n=1 Tax=unclassified Helicobacter TaxID=2593540 RepID=UPI000E1EC687|nr:MULTISPECIES: hypothetical protein [unclassified Helicobacter]RDU57100.1 hypothetical protein CQA49_00070 [Helicobacter sp. MIT 00-7814]RDU57651.1 hypothetical protein CQA37_00070 [Helicobacter sp. MIT 99-10781]